MPKSGFKAVCCKIIPCDKSMVETRIRAFGRANIGAVMKLTLAFLSLIAITSSALAQSGISNQRDMYGNLVRNGGAASGGINQSTPSNGAIRNAPVQTPTNPRSPPISQQINRFGSGTN